MRNKLIYSWSIKIHASVFNKLLESIFCLEVLVKVFSLQKVVKMLEKEVVGWRGVRWMWWIRQNFVAQFVQLLKYWLCDLQSGVVMKNWALSVDQCRLQVLPFSVHLMGLPGILLHCNGFAGIQKAVVDRSDGQLTTKQWPWPFFGATLALWSALELLLGPATELVVAGCYIQSTFRCLSQSDWEMVCCCVE